MSEKELVERAKCDDQVAFTEIIKKYKPSVYYAIYIKVNNETTAEDLTMETFEKAFSKIKTYIPKYRLSTWLYTIAKNHTIDYIRAKQNTPYILSTDDVSPYEELNPFSISSHYQNPEELLISSEQVELIEKAIAGLKSKYKAIIELRADGNSYEEISKKLHIPMQSVKTRIHRSKKQILKSLNN